LSRFIGPEVNGVHCSVGMVAAGGIDMHTRGITMLLSAFLAVIPASGEPVVVPPQTIEAVRPEFPNALRSSGSSGAVTAVFIVDIKGGVREISITWFEVDELGFVENIQVHSSTRADFGVRLSLTKAKNESGLSSAAELDEVPKITQKIAPVTPEELREKGGDANALIEFVVDRHGVPQAPRIVSATHRDFGWAAATAIRSWRFSPPVKKGQAVDAILRQRFNVEFASEAKAFKVKLYPFDLGWNALSPTRFSVEAAKNQRLEDKPLHRVWLK
jgi:TonB family protein